jgi:glucose-6-phosphate dehydrogenase assembly protein OpcA
VGTGGCGRPHPRRWAILEEALIATARAEEWTGRDVTIAQIEAELAELRRDAMDMRTSVMTHCAWAPPEWQDAARQTLAGLSERHPSRTLLLFPQDDGRDALDADVSLQCFTLPGLQKTVCSEVIELRLHGNRSRAPASIVLPLLLPDLPAFLRWRGRPSFGESAFEQLADVADRLVVDSREWADAPGCYPELVPYFERVAVSDIVWTRTLPWRRAIALRWPVGGEVRALRVVGPAQEAALLAGWLSSRLERTVRLEHQPAEELELLELGGEPIRAREEHWSPSDLLSHELDRFSRDPIYEAAVAASGR